MALKSIKCSCGCGKEISIAELEHHIAIERIAGYENVLKFLDIVSRKLKEKSVEKTSLDEKLLYIKKEKRIEEARREIRGLYFAYEEYIKTGEYEPPEIRKDGNTTVLTY